MTIDLSRDEILNLCDFLASEIESVTPAILVRRHESHLQRFRAVIAIASRTRYQDREDRATVRKDAALLKKILPHLAVCRKTP